MSTGLPHYHTIKKSSEGFSGVEMWKTLSVAELNINPNLPYRLGDDQGYDPEVNYRSSSRTDSNRNLGLDYASYPNAKSITLGLNVGF